MHQGSFPKCSVLRNYFSNIHTVHVSGSKYFREVQSWKKVFVVKIEFANYINKIRYNIL